MTTNSASRVVIFTTEASRYFAELIAQRLEIPITETHRRTFGGGERYYRLDIDDRGSLVNKVAIIVGSTHTDEDFLEIARIGRTLASCGTSRRIFVIPFFGYSTMERDKKPGEVVTAKDCACILSSIPNSGLGNVFLMMDLHEAGLVHYFEGDCVRRELYAESILVPAAIDLGLRNFVMATTDLGRSDWVETYAKKLKAGDMAFVRKARDYEITKVLCVIGDVFGEILVPYDDMIRSGSTFFKAMHAYLEKGASQFYPLLGHLAFNDESVIQEIENDPTIVHVIGTNTHSMSQHPLVKQSKKIEVVDVSPIFVEAIQQIIAV
ncbi:MAG: ribose-phosphate diphosphokinase [Candidatus Paceibacterota bacterium]|jgi:ribose-phosphate pyrophosphokinase